MKILKRLKNLWKLSSTDIDIQKSKSFDKKDCKKSLNSKAIIIKINRTDPVEEITGQK